ncbi:hypothetical protein ACFQ0B_49340 [Nonomuraea thailandensis]
MTGGERAPGEPLGEGDPALGLNVLTGQDQVAAKLVDLDPEWPASSEIWGLTIRLAGPRGDPLLTGRHWAAAFRDLWPRGGFERDFPMMGACFTSVLEDVTYGPPPRPSPCWPSCASGRPTGSPSPSPCTGSPPSAAPPPSPPAS